VSSLLLVFGAFALLKINSGWEARTARTRDRIHSKVAGRSQVGIQRSNGCLPSEARRWAINAGHAADGSERSVAHSFAQTAPEALVSFGDQRETIA
jgi:hypothetical protein